ncbi:MAG: hypothetical protein LBV53_02760 [Mycoplasmataceae bacterium]|jgi:hypothetical protein|nr:hypothetical protein [Mycoplasmataceae bacterium]
MANQKDKKIQKIEVVDFNKLPDVSKFIHAKQKNNDLKNLGIIISVLCLGIAIGITLFFLIDFFAK